MSYKIAFDAMGGDYAPFEIVKGAIEASIELNINSVLVGFEENIKKSLQELNPKLIKKARFEIINATENVDMGEKNPAKAVKQAANSSIALANKLVANGQANAVIAAGNTGAATAASLFELKRIKGFDRPCIASLIPSKNGKIFLIDAGSNIESKEMNIIQSALLGQILAKILLGVDNPRVGLLNIGEEPGKGTELYKKFYEALEKHSQINFVGNVEGKTIINGICDLVVCDGFTGNIHLKALEGGVKMFAELIKREMKSNPLGILAGALLSSSGALKRLKAHFDPAEYGGALLGGLNHVSIISHGSSNARAIFNAAKTAKLYLDKDLISVLAKFL
jgi:phosphate acyltransferase